MNKKKIYDNIKEPQTLIVDYMIVITAQEDKENRLKALKLGAKDFISKPFDIAEVNIRGEG